MRSHPDQLRAPALKVLLVTPLCGRRQRPTEAGWLQEGAADWHGPLAAVVRTETAPGPGPQPACMGQLHLWTLRGRERPRGTRRCWAGGRAAQTPAGWQRGAVQGTGRSQRRPGGATACHQDVCAVSAAQVRTVTPTDCPQQHSVYHPGARAPCSPAEHTPAHSGSLGLRDQRGQTGHGACAHRAQQEGTRSEVILPGHRSGWARASCPQT